jgi:hypothetical protein
LFSKKFYLLIHTILQVFIAVLVSIGLLPQSAVFASLALQAAAIVLFNLEYALYSVILAIPFYLVLPNPWFESFSVWRLSFVCFFWHILLRPK